MSGYNFGRTEWIFGLNVWKKGVLCPVFIEMDVVVIMALR